jgi:hypothetical protein
MTNSTATSGRGRITTHHGRLYDGQITLDRWWAHLGDAQRLSRHLDGYAVTPCGDITIPSQAIKSIRWLVQERPAA